MSDSDSETLSMHGADDPVDIHVGEAGAEEDEAGEEEDTDYDALLEELLEPFCETCGAHHLPVQSYDDGYGFVCLYCHEHHVRYQYELQMAQQAVDAVPDEVQGAEPEEAVPDGVPAEEPEEEPAPEAEAAEAAEDIDEPVPKRARHGCQLQ